LPETGFRHLQHARYKSKRRRHNTVRVSASALEAASRLSARAALHSARDIGEQFER
jgi:hypothetical protein